MFDFIPIGTIIETTGFLSTFTEEDFVKYKAWNADPEVCELEKDSLQGHGLVYTKIDGKVLYKSNLYSLTLKTKLHLVVLNMEEITVKPHPGYHDTHEKVNFYKVFVSEENSIRWLSEIFLRETTYIRYLIL